MQQAQTISVGGNKVAISGRFLKTAQIHDELWVENGHLNPHEIRSAHEKAPRFDLFSFIRPLPENRPLDGFHIEWENVAVVRTDNYEEWWNALPQESRKNVRRCQRRGVEVRTVEFNDRLVSGISAIYDETPIRQGRRFWHYKKPLEAVKRENSSYLERSTFLGAFLNDELIGFMKFVKVGRVGRVMQILSKEAHTDKRPMNALLAKAIETCGELGLTHFIYGQYVYGRKENSPMTEFKRRNGFERLDYPRHFLAVSRTGKIALNLGLHKDVRSVAPEFLVSLFLNARARLLEHRVSKQNPVVYAKD
jgi:hypothetical protein